MLLNTKSRQRVQRYAESLGHKGIIIFSPNADFKTYRYALFRKGEQLIPLGKNAQAARFALKNMRRD